MRGNKHHAPRFTRHIAPHAEVAQQVAQVCTPPERNDAASLAWLRSLVQALPSAQRSCLTLYYFEDNSPIWRRAAANSIWTTSGNANNCRLTTGTCAATAWR